MGRHYFQLYHDEDQPCDDLVPIQLLYSGGVLNGKYLSLFHVVRDDILGRFQGVP